MTRRGTPKLSNEARAMLQAGGTVKGIPEPAWDLLMRGLVRLVHRGEHEKPGFYRVVTTPDGEAVRYKLARSSQP